jgi:acyl-CoA reductase-like NAD-dependent aldehyde dehydrogenase
MSKNATKKGIERARKATKKAFPKQKKQTYSELLREVHRKLDKMIERNEEFLRKFGSL